MHPPPSVLVACTGNVCRSPYLERRLQSGLDASWGPGLVAVSSAGTNALEGAPMDRHSLALLAAAGEDGTGFRSRQMTRGDVERAGLVITMTRAHRAHVTRLFPRRLAATHALLDLAQLARDVDLPDVPGCADPDARTWLDLVVPRLAARRGLTPPLPEERSGIVDPRHRDERVFARMAEQIEACLPPILRVLARPSGVR